MVSTIKKYHARTSHAREGNTPSVTACSIGLCGGVIPTSTGRLSDQYWLLFPPSQRLLLRIGIKVADEWQISLDYVRGSNIYVRGYLD